ncbi:MAG: AglZ/HisF2 family acetamidino modification protein [Syntrophales bacterium]|jgi:cyclase|nr:AglZ/HisF2 family acetamidino modification protein [Syntrophales bacterium]MDY0043956.1 AglZ/HisF2 family acetamidino modification protein [Syntrophales bacterium]
MIHKRVIPCLLLRQGGLVKTRKFSEPQYIGDPVNAIRIFNDKEVDELMVLDITASKEGNAPDFGLIEEFAGECFMPLTYGGGICEVAQARQLFASGVEKICLQTAILDDLSLVSRLSDQFGSQSILISVDLKKNRFGKHQLYSASRGKTLFKDWRSFIQQAVLAGAGEIVLNAVDRDGMMEGMDLELIEKAAASVSVPIIAMGGAGSMSDIKAAVDAGASAVAAGAFFVFHGPHRAVLITYPRYEQIKEVLGS